MQTRIDEQTGIRFLPVRNDSGETIPACAAMRISGLDTDGVFLVDKPNSTGQTTGIAFNGTTEIPATVTDDRGVASDGEGTAFVEFPVLALGDETDATPAFDDEWGVSSGSWKLVKPGTGFKAIGNVLTTTAGHYFQLTALGAGGIAKFIRFALPGALATTDASKAGCTVDDFWSGTDPGATVTVYNLPASTDYMFSGASGAKGVATYDDIGAKYWILQLEC